MMNNSILAISGRDMLRSLGIQFRPFTNSVRDTKYHKWSIEHMHVKIIVYALEHQVPRGDTYAKVVNHQRDLAYPSKHGK